MRGERGGGLVMIRGWGVVYIILMTKVGIGGGNNEGRGGGTVSHQ